MNGATFNDCWKKIGLWGDRSCPELKGLIHCRNCAVFEAGAAALLNRDIPAGYREEATRQTAQPRTPKQSGTRPIVVFRVGAEWLALPATVIEELTEIRFVHSLPHRQGNTIKGVVSIRGELVVCLSLEDLLGFDATAENRPATGSTRRAVYRRLLVAAHQSGRIAFAVDEVVAGLRYRPEELNPVPATVARTYTVGLFTWEERNVGVLDSDLFFHAVNRSLA